jgi:hypothetical protein
LDLAATFKVIIKEAQAQLTKLGELETREVEGLDNALINQR